MIGRFQMAGRFQNRARACELSLISLALLVAACSVRHRGADTVSAARPGASGAASQPSSATTIQIDYAHPDDFLRSVTVTKYIAAQFIPIKPGEEQNGASIVRFEGGVPIWQIHADEGVGRELLGEMPLIAAGSRFAIKNLVYGVMPKYFLQTLPDSGPPEPLENGGYYVFEVDRASGSVSWDAIRIESDGTIDSYEAQPRVGESYALCCSVRSDFATPQTTPENP